MEYTFQEMPDVHKTGERKVYPKATHCSQIDYEYFATRLASRCGFSRGTIDGVLGEVAQELEFYLAAGHSVKVDGIGTFNLALGMRGNKKAEEVKGKGERYDTNSVYIKSVHFLPDASWMRHLRSRISLEKVGEVKTLRQESTTREERLRMALGHLKTHPFMRVMDYMDLTGVPHNVACKELRSFSQDPGSGIARSGKGNQLIYLKRT